jgi:hypothetical protein
VQSQPSASASFIMALIISMCCATQPGVDHEFLGRAA